jgi:RNA polymerase sigma factor (sigma-70 family)
MTRHSLVLRLRDRGDTAVWEEFTEVYGPLVYRLAQRRGLQDADASDLCQEVFAAVAAAIGRWDPDPGKGRFRAWLFRIARNRLVDFLADRRRQAAGSGSSGVQDLLDARPAGDAGAEAEFAAEFRRRAFRWAADRVRAEFTEPTWQAFWRTGVEGRAITEVAGELGLSVGAVYVARSRVLSRLRRRVAGLTGMPDWTLVAMAGGERPGGCDGLQFTAAAS